MAPISRLLFCQFLLASLLLFSGSAYSQTPSASSIVYLPNGDSIKGSIDNGKWRKNPASISFRKDAVYSPVVYTPNEIAGFEIENVRYASVSVDGKPKQFYTAIVLGVRSLYYDESRKLYLVGSDDSASTLEKKNYRNQLVSFLSDCFNVEQDVNETSYNSKSLQKLFGVYHECTKYVPVYVKPRAVTGSNFGVTGGLIYSDMKFSGGTTLISRADFRGSVGYAGGIYYEIGTVNSKVSVNNELLLVSEKSKGSYRNSSDPNIYDMNTYVVGHMGVRLANMVRYRFPTNEGHVFVNAGVTNLVKLSIKNELIKFHKYNQTETSTTTKANYDYGKHELGILLGGGYRLRRMTFELRGEKSSGLINNQELKSKQTRVCAFFSYILRK